MSGERNPGGKRRSLRATLVALASAALLAIAGAAVAQAASDTLGKTTVDQRIVPVGGGEFRTLALGPGEPYVVRGEVGASARDDRAARRVSLAYFGQLSDFQLADEESPSRVEFLDPAGPPVDAAWRPWEALNPFIDDAEIRQVNAFAAASTAGGRRRLAPRHGLRGQHRRQRRQPAAQRDRVGADADGGRPARSRQRHRPGRVHAPALHALHRAARLPGCRRGAALHRHPGLRRLQRERRPLLLGPRRPARPLRPLPAVPRADGPRPDSLHRRGSRRPQLRRLRQPRRAGPGQRGGHPGVRADRHRVPEADGGGRQRPPQPDQPDARRPDRAARRPSGEDGPGPARPGSALRLEGAVQGRLRGGHAGRRPRLRLPRAGGGSSLRGRRRLLQLRAGSRPADDLGSTPSARAA